MPLGKLVRSIVGQFFDSNDQAFAELPLDNVSAFSAEGEALLVE